MSERYWIWFSELKTIKPSIKYKLIEHFESPKNLFFARVSQLRACGLLGNKEVDEILRHDLEDVDKYIKICQRDKIEIITYESLNYPERLREIFNPPYVLYVKGKLPEFDENVCVTVVGTRKSSPYGRSVAEKLSYQMASCGALIISGLAEGIDACANKAAMDASKRTVAVLGNGINYCYPKFNKWLYDEIIRDGGCIISEYPPFSNIEKMNFPIRNRIMSGLADCVLVVEAPEKSGALITANYAAEQGKDVFAVMGNIDAVTCVGSNKLIKDGAIPITDGWDILEEYASRFPDVIKYVPISNYQKFDVASERIKEHKEQERIKREKMSDQEVCDLVFNRWTTLTDAEKRIVNAIGNNERQIDDIADLAEMKISETSSTISLLEIYEVVEQIRPGVFKLNF